MVPPATLTAPVVGSSVMPVGHVPLWLTVALPAGPRTAGTPLTLSLAATFGIAVPPVAGAVPLSVIGLITCVTVMVSVLVAQLAGVDLSQSWYVIG